MYGTGCGLRETEHRIVFMYLKQKIRKKGRKEKAPYQGINSFSVMRIEEPGNINKLPKQLRKCMWKEGGKW